ncbi:MAG: MFS transporter [Thermomicrobiales bacterium]
MGRRDSAAPGEDPALGFIDAARIPDVSRLMFARAASRVAMSTVSYGTMVYLAALGSAQWQISVVSASTYLAAVLFGVQGGMLADSLPRRIAIATGDFAIAACYLTVPILFGTGVASLMIMMFVSNIIMQVVTPSIKSAVSLVSHPKDVAVVATSITISGAIASGIGASILAPVLIKWAGLEALLVIAAGFMVLGGLRVLTLPTEDTIASKHPLVIVRDVRWRDNGFSMNGIAGWIGTHRSTGVVVLAGAVAVSLYEAFATMIPVFVRDVLDSNPTNAIYIFAPAGVAFLAAMLAAPRLIDRFGSRQIAVWSVLLMTISMAAFGLIDVLAPFVAPVSPLRLVGWILAVPINDHVLAASVIALPANFGSTAAAAAVQAHINRHVALADQGATFGLQEALDNVASLGLILALGIVSTRVGLRPVFVLAPIIALIPVLWLAYRSYRIAGDTANTLQRVVRDFIGYEDSL